MTRLQDWLFRGLLAAALAGVDWLEGWRRSRMGYANPRVAHLVGALGYHVHSYRVALPNVYRWLRSGEPIFPAVVQVQTVNRCNAACAMCPYPYTIALEPREVMDDALFSRIAAECAATPELHDFVPMAQNEPLLDPKLEARIAEFKRQAQPHQMVELVTNGSALTPQRLQRLADAGLDLLTVSVNADSEPTYHQVMAGLAWPRLLSHLEAIARLRPATVNVFLRYVKQRANQHEYRAFMRRWRRRGFNLMAYDMNNRAGSVRGYADLGTAKAGITRRLRRWVGPRLFPICPYACSVATVLQNGDVPLCGNDWRHLEIIGNVRHASLAAIYNGPRMQAARRLMAAGRYDEIAPCRDCSFRHEWLRLPPGGVTKEHEDE